MLMRETGTPFTALLDEIPLNQVLMMAAGVAKASGRTFAEPDYSEREMLAQLNALNGRNAD